MNLKKLVSNIGFLLVLLFIAASSAFAQVYVSATNGDDTFGTGSAAAPYRTIQKAINSAATGSTIYVEAGVYNSVVLPGEGAPISVTSAKTFTFVGTAVGANTTVSITDGFTLNNANAVVNMGQSGTAQFNLGTSANALVLTAGTMNIGTANVVVGSGATLHITDGTLNAPPTKGSNLNVLFDGANAVSSTSAFLPSSLGSGTLTISKATGDITIDNTSLSISSLVTNNAANVNITGNLTVAANSDITNSSTGTLTIGANSANILTMSTTTGLGQIVVSGGGNVVVNSSVTYNVKNAGTSSTVGDTPGLNVGNVFAVSAASSLTVNGNITFNNTNVASSDGANAVAHTVTLSNAGSKNLVINGNITTPLSGTTFSAPTGGNDNAYVMVQLSNTGAGAFSVRNAALRGTGGTGVTNTGGGTMTLGQAGDTFSTGWDVVQDNTGSKLVVNASATFGGAFNNNASTAGALVVFNTNASISGILTNAAKIQLNSNTLTLSRGTSAGPAVNALNNTGDIYSNTTATVGSGAIKLSGKASTITGAGNLPNVEFAGGNASGPTDYPAISTGATLYGYLNVTGGGTLNVNGVSVVKGDVNMTSGSITLGANLTVEGTFTMPQGTFSFGANTLTLKGNFSRTGGTIDNTAAGTGTLNFAGATTQTFTPGTQMNVYNVTVNNTGPYLANVVANDIVTINNSLIVLKDFTINTGQVALGTSNIRMEQSLLAGVKSARFTNGGRGYTSNGIGGIIFEGDGTVPGVGQGSVIDGAQPFSNIYVRLSVPGNNVYCLGAVKISGLITLDAGGITWNQPSVGADAYTASTLTLDDGLVTPTVVINTQNGHGSPFLVDGADGGAQALLITSVYNLTYTGQTNRAMSATDFVGGSVNNLSIVAGSAAKTITFIAAGGTITGSLNVDNGDVLDLNAQTLTASGNSAAHTVNGSVTNGTFEITGNGTTLTGGVGTGNASSVVALTVDPASGGTFTSTGMKNIGTLVINQSSLVSSITMNSATATVNNFTNSNGTTNLNMNSSVVAAAGTYTVTAGNVTLTMNDGAAGTSTIGTNLAVNGGTFQLGSSVTVAGNVSQSGAGSLVLGDKNLNIVGNYTHAGTGTVTAGAGYIVATPGGAQTYTFTSTVSIPNFRFNGAGNSVALATNGFTVSGAFRMSAGTLALGTLPLTVTGNTIRWDGGTITSGGAAGLVSLQGTAATFTGYANASIPYLEVNTTGTVTFATSDNSTPTPRTFTVTNAFTHTQGNIALGINDLVLTDNGAANASYSTATTAGTVTGSTGSNLGEVVFSGTIAAAQNLTLAADYSIQNVRVVGANPTVTKTDSKVLTVTNNFTLNAANGFTFGNSARLVLGNGATITRTLGAFDVAPTFGTTANVVYNGGALATDVELPTSATVLNNLTIGSGAVTLSANAQVNGTLYLSGGTLAYGGKTFTIATGATINRSAAGSTMATGFSYTTYNLVYSGSVTTGNEFVNNASAVTNLTVSATAANALIQLGANRTVGAFTMSPTGNNAATVGFTPGTGLAPLTLTVTGNTTINNGIVSTNGAGSVGTLNAQGSVIVNGGSLGSTGGGFIGLNLSFGGSGNQTLTLNGNTTIPNLTINMTGTNPTLTVSGGDLTVGTNLALTNGLVIIGSNNNLILGSNPGYTKNANNLSHVVGNVQRQNVNAIGRYEFPVGTMSAYRMAAITFNATPVSGSTITILADSTNPGGTNGFPLTVNGITVDTTANFDWKITASPSEGPSQAFDIEFTGTGFTNYTSASVQDIRAITRLGSVITNPWNGQIGTYSNFEAVPGLPIVRVTNSTGNLISQGAVFTFGFKKPQQAVSISGKVTYGNGATGIKNVVVTLNPGGVTTTTDTTGAYAFTNVANGSYTLTASTANAWLGANATDALLASNYYNGTATLTSVQQLAADVNVSSTVNNTDALLIVRRFAGLDNSFTAGNWVFTSANVTVSGANVTANLQGLVAGDVNASDNLSTLKAQPSVSLNNEGALKVNSKEAFEVPVNTTSSMSLGAVSLRFTYPTDLVTFEGASSNANLIVNDKNGQVTIAWADLSGGKNALNLKAGESLVTLKFKPTPNFKVGSQFGLNLDGQYSEFAKEDGSVMGNVSLAAASVEASVPTEFALKQNYPNPFNPSTTIEYDLPMNASVRLAIYNILGEQVSTLVNQVQTAGSYKVVWNANNFASGMYIYRITVESGSQKFTQVHRMMLLK